MALVWALAIPLVVDLLQPKSLQGALVPASESQLWQDTTFPRIVVLTTGIAQTPPKIGRKTASRSGNHGCLETVSRTGNRSHPAEGGGRWKSAGRMQQIPVKR